MKVSFEKNFSKDLLHIKDSRLLEKIKQLIIACKETDTLNEIGQLKKLKGYGSYYRIRIGDYRVGLEIIGNNVIFVRFLHRKEIYRYFPK